MLEKFLKLTPKLLKLFPISDTSGETMCSNKPGSLNFPKFLKDLFSSFYIFLSAKNYLKRLGNHFFPGITKNLFFIYFSPVSSMMAKRVSARKTTFLKPKSVMKARGYSLTK